jgi:predicted amidohydrolase
MAQLDPLPGSPGANAEVVVDLLDQHPDVDLAVFPELFLTGYNFDHLSPVDCTAATGPLAAIAAAARHRGTAVVVGTTETTRFGPADTAVCIDEHGAVTACYHKVHLFADERRHFVAGREYLTTVLAGVVVAPLVCYDIEFPEAARAAAAAGAELLVTISANMDPYGDEHELFVRCRALENRLPHVYVNRVGAEHGYTYCGRSMVVDPSGQPVATLAPYQAEVRVVEVELGRRPEPDYLAERRTGIDARSIPAALATKAGA